MPLPDIAFKTTTIPEELKQLPQWVLWKYRKTDKEKLTKMPVNPYTLGAASSTHEGTWSTFEVAVEKARENHYGIGFVFTEKDHLVGIDIDKTRKNETQDLSQDIIDRFATYTEVSPSGNGYHLYVIGAKHFDGNKNTKLDLEVYDRGRFFTVTGNRLGGTKTVVENQQALDWFGDTFFSNKPAQNAPSPQNTISATDQEVLDLLFNAKNGTAAERLFDGQWDSDYPSQSEADLAFINRLVFYTQDRGQIDRIVRSSGLYRKKWERKDYRKRVIDKALSDLTETYQGKSPEVVPFNLSTDVEAVETNPLYDTHYTDRELGDLPDRGNIYLVDKLIPKGCTIIGAPAKSMKSFLMLHLAECLVKQQKLFGEFEISDKHKILLLDRENDKYLLKRRMELLKIFDKADGNLMYNNFRYSLKKTKHVKWLLDYLKEVRPGIVVFDSMIRFLEANENNSEEVSRFFKIVDLIKDMGIDVLILHHNNKNPDAKGANKMRGSTDFSAYPDCVIQIKKKSAPTGTIIKVNQTDNRHDEELAPFGVEVVDMAGELHFLYMSQAELEEDKIQLGKQAIRRYFTFKKNLMYKHFDDPKLKHIFAEVGRDSLISAAKDMAAAGELEFETGAHNAHVYNLAEKLQ